MSTSQTSASLRQQLDYYRARAAEYDQWWLRQGRYDRGPDLNGQWFGEAGAVSSALSAFRPAGRVLELAAGTGIWSEQLLPFADHLTVVDGSPEMLAINAARLRSPEVLHVEADLFQWRPTEQYDTVFFGFWLSHVPPERFESFWQLFRACLAPGGRVFFVDSRREPTSTAIDHRLPEADEAVSRRRLNDGREFDVYKVFYDPVTLTERLRELGWDFDIRQTDHYFLYGSGRLAPHGALPIVVRRAEPADFPAIAELMTALDYPSSPAEVARRVSAHTNSGSSAVFVAEAASSVVGVLSFHCIPLFHADGFLGRITSLVVAPGHRQRGIGGSLMAAAEEYGWAQGCTRIEVTSGDHRSEAHSFYERRGYRIDCRRFIKQRMPS